MIPDAPQPASFELRLLRAVTSRLPPVPRATGIVNRLVKPWFLRKPRADVEATVHGSRMSLRPSEAVDGAYLFCPQLYDRRELSFLRTHLAAGDRFVDLGAHIGLYTLLAAQLVGASGRVLGVEAFEPTFRRLSANVDRNSYRNVDLRHVGVSDSRDTRVLWRGGANNIGGNTLTRSGANSQRIEEVEVWPLLDLLQDEWGNVPIKGMKVDIEGEDLRTLSRFFAEAAEAMWPDFLIVELPVDTESQETLAKVITEHGYRERDRQRGNATNATYSRCD